MISTRPVTAEVVPSTWQNGGPILVAGDNRPPSASALSARAQHAVVPREPLPGHLPARIEACAAGESLLEAPLAVTNRTGSPARSAEGETPTAPVRPADALDPRSPLRPGEQVRARPLGGRCDRRKQSTARPSGRWWNARPRRSGYFTFPSMTHRHSRPPW